MTSRILRLPLLCVAALVLAASASAQNLKILTVNVEEALQAYYKQDIMEKSFESLSREAQADLQERLQVIRDKEAEIRSIQEEIANPMLSSERQEELRGNMQQQQLEGQRMLQEYQQYQQRVQRDLAAQQQEQLRTLVDDIKDVVFDIAKEENADLVFDRTDFSRLEVPTVLYADRRFDITNRVINRLNADDPALQQGN